MEVTQAPPTAAMEATATTTLSEGRDYYFEHGRFVLTAAYLLRREACCGNGCRHCPYRKTSNRT
jgi:hypothetical protein